MSNFSGQLAVITGAASGIGRALAHAASSRGMNLLLADRDPRGLDQVVANLQKTGQQTIGQVTDVTAEADLHALALTAWKKFGQVNLLFNNAGICPLGTTWDMKAEDWRSAVNVNVMGVIYGQMAFLPLMMAQAGSARIINTGSVAGLSSNPGGVTYAVTKHAVVALSEGLFMDLQAAQSSVAVSVICPGFVNTNLGAVDRQENTESIPKSVRLGREALQRTLEQGLAADELAERVFFGIDAGQFWIFPQPEALAGFDLRASSIQHQTDPSFIPMLQ